MSEDLKDLGTILLTEGANKELQEDVIDNLKEIQELPEFLRDIMSEDVKRYFNASTPVEQLLAKGAYFRTKWLLNKLIQDKNELKRPEKTGRYIA